MEQVPELSARGLPVLPDSWSTSAQDMELLRSEKVDLVIASVPYREASLSAILKSGLPVLAFAPRSLAEIYADTRLLGSLVDATDPAERLIGQMERALDEVHARVAASPGTRPRVCCEEWNNPAAHSLIHSQPWVNELVQAAGGEPVGIPGRHAQAVEAATADPDALILAWCGAGDRVPLRRVAQQRQWEQLRAVQERRMYCIPDEWMNTPAIPSLLEGLACVAHCVRPELFPAPVRLRRLEA